MAYDYCTPAADAEDSADERAAYYVMLREAAKVTARDWVMSDEPERTAVHWRGRALLVQAAGWSMVRWCAQQSAAARAAVLLRGAAALGITTSWRGQAR